jgi:hypothetical protein
MTRTDGVKEGSGYPYEFRISDSVDGFRAVDAGDNLELPDRVALSMLTDDLGAVALDIERSQPSVYTDQLHPHFTLWCTY